MLSLSEISVIEEADSLGCKGLGVALDKLLERWNHGLRDEETFIRIVFLKWYSISEPNWYNGLPDSLTVSLESFIEQKIVISALTNEEKFIVGILSYNFAWCFGDETKWKKEANRLLLEASSDDSSVFKNWKYLIGISNEVHGLRKNINPELHARFNGRGEMGRYLLHILNRTK